jgi:uncharacterized membrane protein
MKKKLVAVHHLMVGLLLLMKGVDKIQHHHSFIIHLFECIALCLTTYVYFKEGKNFLPYVTMAASIGFFVATLVHLKAFFKERHSR